MSRSPYTDRPESSFWRSAVTELSIPRDVYKKKFLISKFDKLMTAGSCFAQHVGAALTSHGFQVIDAEPPPSDLPQWKRKEYGYDLYSARYGNIYTTLQLLQLAREALEVRDLDTIVWKRDGRFLDALRPAIEPSGFRSVQELQAHRNHHLKRVQHCLLRMDVLIFTLGLTEAWRHRPTGRVLPVAPGVLAPEQRLDDYEFVNFGYRDNLKYLKRFLRLVEGRRSGRNPLRVVLTVSPVPLTATASNRHVLVANSYSKAVLRAVAEDLFLENPYVDYVPSFEMVTNPKLVANHYSENWRSVSRAGVATAMHCFLEQHHDFADIHQPVQDRPTLDPNDFDCEAAQAIACEEQLLDSQNCFP